MDDPVRHERFVAVGKWVNKEGNHKKNQDVFFLYRFFHEWYKKIPNSLSIGLYLDQLINLSSIRKADKSRLSCTILIKIYREVPETLRNHWKEGGAKSPEYKEKNRIYFKNYFVQYVFRYGL